MSHASVAFVGVRRGGKSAALAFARELYPNSTTSPELQFPETVARHADEHRWQFEELFIYEDGPVSSLQERGWAVVQVHNANLDIEAQNLEADYTIHALSLGELRRRVEEVLTAIAAERRLE